MSKPTDILRTKKIKTAYLPTPSGRNDAENLRAEVRQRNQLAAGQSAAQVARRMEINASRPTDILRGGTKKAVETPGAERQKSRGAELAGKQGPLSREEQREARDLAKSLRGSFTDNLLRPFRQNGDDEDHQERLKLASALDARGRGETAALAGAMESIPFAGRVIEQGIDAQAALLKGSPFGAADYLPAGYNAMRDSAREHQGVYLAGHGAMDLIQMMNAQGLVSGAAGRLKGFTKLPTAVQGMASSGLALGGLSALRTAGNGGSAGDVAKSGLVSGAAGAAGSLASSAVSALGTKALFSAGAQNSVPANLLREALSGTAFAVANMGTTMALDKEYRPTAGEAVKDLASAAAFSTLSSALGMAARTKQAKAQLDAEVGAMKSDFAQIVRGNGASATNPKTLDDLAARSARVRQTLATTQYVGQQETVTQALEFLDQLDDAVAEARAGISRGGLPAGGGTESPTAAPHGAINIKIEPSARTSASETPTVQPVNAIDDSISNTIVPKVVEGVKEKSVLAPDTVSLSGLEPLARPGESFRAPNALPGVGLQTQKSASTGETGEYYFDAADQNNSWKDRTYTQGEKTFIQSSDRQRMYEVPKQSEIGFGVKDDGTVVLDDDVVGRLDRNDYRDFVKAYAAMNLVTTIDPKTGAEISPKPISIESDGSRVIITQTGINDVAKKIRTAGIKSQDNVSSILLLDRIIENAQKIGTVDNKHGKETPFTEYMAQFSVGGRNYNVKLYIKNAKQGDRYHYHTLDKIEVGLTDGSNGINDTETYQASPTSSTTIIADFSTGGNTKFAPKTDAVSPSGLEPLDKPGEAAGKPKISALRDMAPSVDGKMDSQIYNWNIKTGATLDGEGRGQSRSSSGVSSVAPQDAALGTSASSAASSAPIIADSSAKGYAQSVPKLDAAFPDGSEFLARPEEPLGVKNPIPGVGLRAPQNASAAVENRAKSQAFGDLQGPMSEENWESLAAQAERESGPNRAESRERAVQGASDALDAFLDNQTGDPERDGTQALVRTENPEPQKRSLKETAAREWGTFRRKMVDSGDTVARMGKEVGDRSLYSYYNFARAASNTAGNAIRKGGAQTDVLGREVGPSLADIWEPVRNRGAGYYRDFQAYLFHRHNVDRMSRDNTVNILRAKEDLNVFDEGDPEIARIPESDLARSAAEGDPEARERMRLLNAYERAKAIHNKPVFGYDVSAAESTDAISRYEQAYPEFREQAKTIYQYQKNLMQYRVDSGLLTREQADHIEAVYPHYVPTYRVTEPGQTRIKKRGQKVKKTIHRAEGGNSDLMPLHVAMARQTRQVIGEGSKNRFGARLLADTLANGKKGPSGEYVYNVTDAEDGRNEDTFDLEDDPTPRHENTFTVYKDGKAYEMILEKGLYEGVEVLSPEADSNGMLYNLGRNANNLFKALVTGYNPMFSARNVARDLQEAGLYSRDPAAWAKNYPLAAKQIASGGEWWKQYQALGGVYSSVFDYQKGYRVEDEEHGVLRRNTLDRIEALNMGLEQAPRLAEFMAQAKKGDGTADALVDAMLAAADVTTNFGRSGKWGKALNQTFVPFFNPAIQGLDKMGRTFLGKKAGKKWLNLIARCVVLGLAPAVVNELLCRGSDGWDDIRQSDKDSNWLIYLGDGKYLKIPKGRDMSVAVMTADRVGDALRGEEVDLGGTLKTAANQIAPPNPLENNVLAAWMDADLLDPDSPGKTWYGADIESQRLQGYAPGQRYDEYTDAFSKALGGALGLSPKKINYLLDQYSGVVGDFVLPLASPAGNKNPLAPFGKAFVLDSVTTNRINGEFYDTADAIKYAKNAGDGAMTLVSRYYNAQSSAVSDLYSHIREIENGNLPNAEKLEQVRQAKATLNAIQKNAMENLDAYEAAARKYYTGDSSDDLAKAYREANREAFGAEYALRVYDDDVYGNAAALNKENGMSYDSFYDAYFQYKEAKGTGGGAAQRGREALVALEGMDNAQKSAFGRVVIGDSDALDYSSLSGLAISQMSDSQKAQAKAAQASGITGETYLAAYEAQKEAKGDRDKNGNTITLTASKKKKAAIDAAAPELTQAQREVLYESFGVSQKVWGIASESRPTDILRSGTASRKESQMDVLRRKAASSTGSSTDILRGKGTGSGGGNYLPRPGEEEYLPKFSG